MEPLDPQRFRTPPTLTAPEVAEGAGVSLDFARRIFRALGLPDVGDDQVEFAESDVEVLAAVGRIMRAGFSEDDLIGIARTYGYGLSRVADAEVRLFYKTFIEPLRAKGTSEDELAEKVQDVVPTLLELLAQQLDFVHRRHLGIALQRVTPSQGGGRTEVLATGFVDLVGFSRLAEDLQGNDLGQVVDRFETQALEACVAKGARLVKMIGDAAMFVAADASAAVGAALDVVEAASEDDELPEARAGIAIGDVVSIGGDYFGHPVNVAARLTSFARPGTVVATNALIDATGDTFDVSHIGKTRLKGVGAVTAVKVNAPSFSTALAPGAIDPMIESALTATQIEEGDVVAKDKDKGTKQTKKEPKKNLKEKRAAKKEKKK